MAWRIALAALLLGWSAASYARHSFAVLDPRRASPGLSLQLAEVPSGGNGNGVRYALRAAGFPQSVTFGVWTRDFGRDFQELMSGIQFDAKGVRYVRLTLLNCERGCWPGVRAFELMP